MKEIAILGIGGNGVLTVAELIANIAIKKNKEISIYNFYGSQMRGGEVGAILKIDDKMITNPKENVADIFVIINDKFLYKYKYLIDDRTIMIHEDHNMKAFVKVLKMVDLCDINLIEEVMRKKFKKSEVFDANFSIIKNMLGEM